MSGPVEPERFRGLFAAPSVKELQALSGAEFESFTAYVFRRAGYDTVAPPFKLSKGTHLELFAPGDRRTPVGGVAVYQARSADTVGAPIVRKLQNSPAVRKHGAAAYCVTSGQFDKDAIEQAQASQRTYLLDGEALCRYIAYVRGSRYDETMGVRVLIPPDVFPLKIGSSLGPQPTHRTKILAIANNKGGVGKTTTARHIALGLALKGRRVLAVDMDPQLNLTETFLEDHDPVTRSRAAFSSHLAHYFAGRITLAQLARPTAIEGVALIPAHQDLSLLDTGGAGRPDVEARFSADLFGTFSSAGSNGTDAFDWIVLDTPPAISLYTRAALCAADYVIVPARSRPSSLSGITNMLRTMDTMATLKGAPPTLLGCLVTHWGEDQHSIDTYTRLEELFDNRHSRILGTYIPFDVTIEKAHGPTHHRASKAYQDLVEEMLYHVDPS